jgi:hypothetical protein
MQDHPLFTREALQELSVYLRPTGWQGWVENISNQPENSIIRRMEQLLHDRETIEAGRQYSIRDLPPRWQEIIRRSLAERGFSQHEVDAQASTQRNTSNASKSFHSTKWMHRFSSA